VLANKPAASLLIQYGLLEFACRIKLLIIQELLLWIAPGPFNLSNKIEQLYELF
jgi:hypothetical protein